MIEYEVKYWDKGLHYVAGVDEAGRGPIAGPLVAAAVVFPPYTVIEGINDSKKLTPNQREKFLPQIYEKAISVSIGIVSHCEIERYENILIASQVAMKRAVKNLSVKPEIVLVDGKFEIPNLDIKQEAIVGGDGKSLSIASASIVAKTYRDRLMEEFDILYPQYEFAKNKGYPTKRHKEILKKIGFCPIHRKCFKIFKKLFPEFFELLKEIENGKI